MKSDIKKRTIICGAVVLCTVLIGAAAYTQRDNRNAGHEAEKVTAAAAAFGRGSASFALSDEVLPQEEPGETRRDNRNEVQPRPNAVQPRPNTVQPRPNAEQPRPNAVQPRPDAATVVSYAADHAEGIIGLYGGRAADNPADNVFTVFLDKTPSANDRVWLCYDLTGARDFTCVPRSINDNFSQGGYTVKKSEATARQRERLDPSELKKGANRILFSLPENADFGYKITGLTVETEKGGDASPLVVDATDVSYDGKVYVRGFIRGKEKYAVSTDGKTVETENGRFEAVVPLNGTRTVEVKAVSGKKEYARTLSFKEDIRADAEYALEAGFSKAAKTFVRGKEERLELSAARLDVKENALLEKEENLSLAALRHTDLPALDMGMTNVTAQNEGTAFCLTASILPKGPPLP